MADQASPGRRKAEFDMSAEQWAAMQAEGPSTQADETDSDDATQVDEPAVEEPSTSNLCWIETSLTFTSSFTPPNYLIDEVLQRRFLYSMTAPTGGGKTSLALSMAAHLDLGRPLGGHEVEKCKVLFLAGENPDDVCMRWIKLCEELKLDHSQVGVHFLPHVFSLTDRNTLARIKSESDAARPIRCGLRRHLRCIQ